MTDLLDFVVEAHGGLKRWDEMETASAHLIQGSVMWEMVGQKGVLDDIFVTASLHEERVSHYPFGAAGRSVFTPERVVIDDDDGTVVEALDQPRASFAGHTVQTPWTAPQLAYFVGTARWTYLAQPSTFTLPGFATSELEPWQENGEQWRRLRVAWPGNLASLEAVLTVYVGEDGLIRREATTWRSWVAARARTTCPATRGSPESCSRPGTGSFRGRRRATHSPSRC
jgi:hypothetical protein